MRPKGDGSFLSSYAAELRLHARGLAVFLIIALTGAGLGVSPAIAAYVDIFGGNVLLAVPVANDDVYTVDEDTDLVVSAVLGVLANDSDADADPLTAVLDSDVSNGALLLDPNGSFNYAPGPNFNGVDSFTYHANDGSGDSNIATVTITVNAVNDAPVLIPVTDTGGDEGTLISFDADATDVDSAPESLSFSLVNHPTGATIDPVTGGFSWTPTEAQGPSPTLDDYTFNICVSDGDLETCQAVKVTVNEVNQLPVLAGIGNKTVNETVLVSFDAESSDPDLPENTLTYSLTGTPAGATFNTTSGLFSWTPTEAQGPANYPLTVCVSDGSDLDCEAITINVTEIFTAPVLDAIGNQNVNETQLLAFTATASDIDLPEQTLSFSLGAGAPAGAAITAGGSFSWTPSEAQGGAIYPITVIVSDGGLSDSELINVNVAEVNTPPVPDTENLATSEDINQFVINGSVLLDGDTDSDLPTQTLILVDIIAVDPTHGTVTTDTHPVQGLRYLYVPDPDYNGPDSFQYRVSDGVTTADGLVNITVNPVNDPPVANPQTVSTDEDTQLPIVLTGSDIDGDTLTYNAPSTTLHGTLTGTGANRTYTPAVNYAGPDSFTFTVNDGTVNSAPATINITVNPLNDPPVAADDGYDVTEDVVRTVTAPGVLSNDFDPDSTITAAVVTTTSHGTLNLSANGGFTYTPAANYFGLDSFTYTASDGSLSSAEATVTLNVAGVNDLPVANTQPTVVTNEDVAVPITLTGSDVETAVLTYAIAAPPAHGTFSGVIPDLTYTPAVNYNGSDSFSFTVNDGTATSTPAVINITINAVNDAPAAATDNYATNEDSPLTVPTLGVLGNDTDVEGSALTAILVTPPTKGVLNLSTNGSFVYTPNLDLNGADSFTYKANDGLLDSNIATVNLTINAINDAPVLDSITAKIIDEMVNATFTATAADVETPPASLSYTLSGLVPVGAAISSAGVFNWNPVEVQGPQAYSFSVCVSDGSLSDCQVVDFTVNEVNRAPVAVPDTVFVLEDSSANVFTPLSNDSDPDLPANILSLVSVGSASHGGRTWDPDLNTVTYTPTANYAGDDFIPYGMKDAAFPPFLTANSQININVTAVNDAPSGTSKSVTIAEDGSYTFSAADFPVTDTIDAPSPNTLLGIKITTLPAVGSLTLSNLAVNAGQVIPALSLGSLKYTPPPNAFGSPYASFTFQVQDNGGTANGGIDLDPTPNQFTFNVTAVPDEPFGNPDAYAIGANTPLPFTVSAPGVLANDSDGDGFGAWTLTVIDHPDHGTVVLQNNGSFTYTQTGTPPTDYVDTFTYQITDNGFPPTLPVPVTLTVDRVGLETDQVAQWVLPFPLPNQFYHGTTETIELKVFITNPDDVERIEFWFFDHTHNPQMYVLIGKDFSAEFINGKYYYSTMLDLDILPIAPDVQVFARTYDNGNNFIIQGLVNMDADPELEPYLSRLFVDHKGSIFLPAIMR